MNWSGQSIGRRAWERDLEALPGSRSFTRERERVIRAERAASTACAAPQLEAPVCGLAGRAQRSLLEIAAAPRGASSHSGRGCGLRLLRARTDVV